MINALPRLIIEVWSRQIPLKTSLPKQTCLITIVSKYWLLEVKYFSEDDENEEDDEEDNENDDNADDVLDRLLSSMVATSACGCLEMITR